MNNFKMGQRVEVTTNKHPLIGRRGRVVRIRTGSGAWVNMDNELPDKLCNFPDKSDSRHNWIVLYPEDCKEFRNQ